MGLGNGVIGCVWECAFPGTELNEVWLWSEFIHLQLCNEDGRMKLLRYSLITCAVSQCRRYILPQGPGMA